ncbi:MAG: beta-fructofuranosidase [Verrucomicrobiales bacterium]|jgi:beta-fructofuranosidase
MYSGRGFRDWEIGDIDIIKHGGIYHLFHLVLPNHDYIAHAISSDCINWTRVKNALFVGDPGEWDDDMLWTMNVCHTEGEGGGFEMFYTGLSQREHGYYQRIGRATSPNLYDWEKDSSPPYPIESAGPHYESPDDNARQWVSFRDPYHYKAADGSRYLLVCARTNIGAISRRGCVGVIALEGERAALEEPLFVPRVYDDVECPAIVEMDGAFYLIGSIREDVRVHYWRADRFRGEYISFPDNLLLPQGNYAARVSRDGDKILLYSFFVAGRDVQNGHRYFCPPKELRADDSGHLLTISLSQWADKIVKQLGLADLPKVNRVLGNPAAAVRRNQSSLRLTSRTGYEIAALKNPFANFIWRGRLVVHQLGKIGLVFNTDKAGDGYYISIEPLRSLVQIRAWASCPDDIHKDYQYETLQAHSIPDKCAEGLHFELLCYGHYIEFSVNGIVRLSLVDAKFSSGAIGLFCDSASIELTDFELLSLDHSEEDELSQQFDATAGEWLGDGAS